MTRVPISEAKAKLPEMLRRVEAGEEIVLTRSGRPVARLLPMANAGDKIVPLSAIAPTRHAEVFTGEFTKIDGTGPNPTQARQEAPPAHPKTPNARLAPQPPGLTWAEIIKASR